MRDIDIDILVAPHEDAAKRKTPRILVYDIETSPNLVFAWGLYNQNIAPSQVLEQSRMLSFAAKWYDEKKVHYFSEFHDGHEEMVRRAHDLLNEADIVVGYNQIGFDNKHLNREFLLAGLTPPSPWRDIDLLRVIRKEFKFTSNRLGSVSEALDLGGKLDTGGQDLWNRVLQGDAKAWEKFKRYNRQDVVLTEALLRALGPWVKQFPHAGLWNGNTESCYRCGSDNLEPAGIAYSNVTAWPKFLCTDCGAWNKVIRGGHTRAA
jgi:DNA polymerase elongation subunit (family B)